MASFTKPIAKINSKTIRKVSQGSSNVSNDNNLHISKSKKRKVNIMEMSELNKGLSKNDKSIDIEIKNAKKKKESNSNEVKSPNHSNVKKSKKCSNDFHSDFDSEKVFKPDEKVFKPDENKKISRKTNKKKPETFMKEGNVKYEDAKSQHRNVKSKFIDTNEIDHISNESITDKIEDISEDEVINFEENEIMTLYANRWVLRSDVAMLDAHKKEIVLKGYNKFKRRKLQNLVVNKAHIYLKQNILSRELQSNYKNNSLKESINRLNSRISEFTRQYKEVENQQHCNDKSKNESVSESNTTCYSVKNTQMKKNKNISDEKLNTNQNRTLDSEQNKKKLKLLYGNWVNRDISQKLKLHKKKLLSEGVKGAALRVAMRKFCNSEVKRQNGSKNVTCFKCRKVGHSLSDCPEEEGQAKTCFKCGSLEHTYRDCKSRLKGFANANCFTCGIKGHLSKHCPNNSKGLYPNGGACRKCGGVTHLAKDCQKSGNQKNPRDQSEFKMKLINELKTIEDEDFS